MAFAFDPIHYMGERSDVFTYYVNAGAKAGTGMEWAEFAEYHYNNFGWKEGSNPNSQFNTVWYLQNNIDVANVGVNPFQHYLTHGVYEGRAPSASFPKLGEGFDADAYLAANPDLGTNNIDTPQEAYAHFVLHGQFENRPGAPKVETDVTGATFVLTPGSDYADSAGSFRNGTNPFDFKFTSGNEIVIASNTTIAGGDALIDGSTNDNDEFRLAYTGGNLTLPTTQNIETIKINASSAATGTISFSGVTGAKKVELTGALAGALTLGSIGGTGVTSVDGSALTSVVNGYTVDFSAATGTDALNIIGSRAGDSLTGGNGNDTIDGGAGDDTIVGGAGNDKLTGGAGNDTITGGTGNDTIDGGDGNDTLDGGAGNDTITGGAGSDLIIGGAGTDTLSGDAGDDFLFGGAGADTLDGGDGNDFISGGAGADTINGGAGNDTIIGGAGGDTITGGAGDDTIYLNDQAVTGDEARTVSITTPAASAADDTATDVVIFEGSASANGNDTIYGFATGASTPAAPKDVLDFSAFLGGDVSFVAHTTNTNLNTADYNVIAVDTAATLANLQWVAGQKAVLLNGIGSADVVVSYVEVNSLGEAVTTQVATLIGVDAATFVDSNFA